MVNFHDLCLHVGKGLIRCAGLSESLLVIYAISTKAQILFGEI